MERIRHRIATLALLVTLVTGAILAVSSRVAIADSRNGFNDEYIYATTRDVNQMDAPAGLKLTLFPVTIVLDTALLPFAVIAGFVT